MLNKRDKNVLAIIGRVMSVLITLAVGIPYLAEQAPQVLLTILGGAFLIAVLWSWSYEIQ